MEASKISLKLFINPRNNKVLFAEAGKNFVDFLFHLLSLPLGAATRLLRKQETIGSLENLYHSIENLDEVYIQPNQNKDIFLRPKPPAGAPAFPVTLLALEDPAEPVTDDPRAVCPSCNRTMTSSMKYVASPQTGGGNVDSKAGGFAKPMSYMITDDLEVKPLSTISIITLLNKFDFRDLSALKQKAVDLGRIEAMKLLKASLESKTVLTSVFLDVERAEFRPVLRPVLSAPYKKMGRRN